MTRDYDKELSENIKLEAIELRKRTIKNKRKYYYVVDEEIDLNTKATTPLRSLTKWIKAGWGTNVVPNEIAHFLKGIDIQKFSQDELNEMTIKEIGF